MAGKAMNRAAAVALVSLLAVAAVANTAAFSICHLSLDDLRACQPYGKGGDPDDGCCAPLRALTPDDLRCLCDYKNSNSARLRAMGIDGGRAKALLTQCNVRGAPATC